ncbi:unnamed protein product [Arctia plantaginis]|uniref:Uncharacterized protein n=1 Tax=Arctia plantaginis TaxID=874455 RepID=A0A8S1AZ88_ARCPL|nr:unnamed protein product [Arctia plantaginis]
MSSIIIDKLKEIEQSNKNGNCNYYTSKEISTCGLKSRSVCRAQSREHTPSILTNNDGSDYHQEYHTVKVWAGKLRSLKSEQRLYAEKAIYDVLFEAQLGNLNKSSVKINNRIFHTKQPHSIFNSCNNNPSERPIEIIDNHLPSSQNDEHENRSSEIIIAESFPTDIGALSSECQVTLDDIPDLNTDTGQKRQKKFVDIVPSLVLPVSSRSQSWPYGQTVSENTIDKNDSEETIDKNDSFSGTIATNMPEQILIQLSRYITYFYNCIRNYV